MYHLLNAVIAPRPIAWISSRAADGTLNAAPHSYTTVFSTKPAIVGFVSIGRKDTVRNVEATGDFVYHIADAPLLERLNRTAADFPPDVSEFEWAGLTPVASDNVRSPRIAEAPVAFEAKLVEVHRVASTDNYLVLGEIVRVHLRADLMAEGRIDTRRLNPVGRLAGSLYARLGEIFPLSRPSYKSLLDNGEVPMDRVGDPT